MFSTGDNAMNIIVLPAIKNKRTLNNNERENNNSKQNNKPDKTLKST